jgi:23S rRNA (adenine2503-C2)-methyltransferase
MHGETDLVVIRKPRLGIPRPAAPNLRGFTREQLEELVVRRWGEPRFRATQLFQWIHRHGVSDVDAMTNLSRALRERLRAETSIETLAIDAVLAAADGTRKLRLRTADGHFLESVLIPNDDRGLTLCISSQVGCSLTCQFCATQTLGFTRNLDAWEIVDQVLRARDVLARDGVAASVDGEAPEESWLPRITNIVYMGMGEPLHNFASVATSLAILTDPEGLALAGRRITVSTSGLVPAIERFAREGLAEKVGLAISLNATTDAVRDEVMPINRKWNIETLLAALRALPLNRRRGLTFEYVLLADVNDSEADARRLVELVADFRAHVNVIPWNPHEHAPFRRPSEDRIRRFMDILRRAQLRVYLRTPRGDDIGAACGQLALDAGTPQPATGTISP